MICDNSTVPVKEYIIDSPTTGAATISVTGYFSQPATYSWNQDVVVGDNTVFVQNIDSGHSWMRRGLQAIAKFGSMNANWHGENYASPNSQSITLATEVLRKLSEVDFEPSSIDPSTGEGICIHFTGNRRRANIECFNTGEIFAATVKKDGEPVIWEISEPTIRDGLARIYEFIGG